MWYNKKSKVPSEKKNEKNADDNKAIPAIQL